MSNDSELSIKDFANLFALENLPEQIKSERYSEPLTKLNDALVDEIVKRAHQADIYADIVAYALWEQLTAHFSQHLPETAERLPRELRRIRREYPWVPPF